MQKCMQSLEICESPPAIALNLSGLTQTKSKPLNY